MITAATRPSLQQIAAHYDSLSDFYLSLWGEHVHHGLWQTGRETPEEAVRALVDHAANLARIGRDTRVCDVGCGYGATARMLARERGARVCGLTVSRVQYEYATTRAVPPGVRFLLSDWMSSALPARSFDAVIAIESSEHMPDKAAFVREGFRVLAPGGRLVVCAWLAPERPGWLARKALLERICAEGRLPSLASAGEFAAWMADAGFVDVHAEDLSEAVRRTWTICAARMLTRLLVDPGARRFVRTSANVDRVFALTVPRIAVAYSTGALRYGVFCATKPQSPPYE